MGSVASSNTLNNLRNGGRRVECIPANACWEGATSAVGGGSGGGKSSAILSSILGIAQESFY